MLGCCICPAEMMIGKITPSFRPSLYEALATKMPSIADSNPLFCGAFFLERREDIFPLISVYFCRAIVRSILGLPAGGLAAKRSFSLGKKAESTRYSD